MVCADQIDADYAYFPRFVGDAGLVLFDFPAGAAEAVAGFWFPFGLPCDDFCDFDDLLVV